VRIKQDGVLRNLGAFLTFEEAVVVREKAVFVSNFHSAHNKNEERRQKSFQNSIGNQVTIKNSF